MPNLQDLTTINTHATVVYPNILDEGAPRVQESRRFIYQDEDTGNLYTDTGYKIVRCYPGSTDSYTCYADKASL